MATAEEKAAAKRDELLKALAEFGITNESGAGSIAPLTGDEDNKKLADLLKAAKAEAKAAAKREDENDDATEATVFDVRGNPARTYTKELHGEDFRAKAEEYAKKRGWEVR